MSRASILKSFLFGLCACINLAIPGTLLCAMNTLFTDWLTYFQADKGAISAVQATCYGITFAGGFVAGVLERKLGERRCLMLGTFLSTVGLFSGSYAPSVPVLILSVGVVTGSGFCILYLSSLSTAVRRFPKRAGFMSSAMVATTSLFNLSTPSLYRFFSDEYMWRGCLMFASAVVLHTFVFGLLLTSPLLQSTQESHPPRPDQRQAHEVPVLNNMEIDVEPDDSEATVKVTYTEHHSWLRDSKSRSSPDISISEHTPLLESSQSSENQRDVSPIHQNRQKVNLSFLKNPLYVCIALYSVVNISTLNPFVIMVLDYTSGRGWGVQDGVLINFLFYLSTLLSRALGGVVSLCPCVNNTVVLIIGGLIGSTGVCFIGQVDSFTLAAVFYACMGFGYGVTVGMCPAAVMDTIGTRDFSIGIGLQLTVEGIACAVVGILTGVLVDKLQSYSLISLVYGVVNLVFTILLLVVFLRCRR